MKKLIVEDLKYSQGGHLINFKNIILELGTINIIIGKNGSGKTAFCEAFLSLQKEDKISIGNKLVISDEVILVDSKNYCFFEMTGYDFLIRYGGNFNTQKISELAYLFGLPLINKVETYSFSMKRILQFLRAFSFDRKIYLFDDLFISLDFENLYKLKNALTEFRKNTSLIIATATNIDMIAEVADNVFNLSNNSLESIYKDQTFHTYISEQPFFDKAVKPNL